MQAMPYDDLQEKITEARRAKHDVRHHIMLMQEYLADGRSDELGDYLRRYSASLPDDTLIRFCQNAAANAVLLYFAQQAKNENIDYLVKADIPADTFLPDPDLSVLFGNLIENALEACRAEPGDRKIAIRAALTGGTLCVTVDNTFTGARRAASRCPPSTSARGSAPARSKASRSITAASAASRRRTGCSMPRCCAATRAPPPRRTPTRLSADRRPTAGRSPDRIPHERNRPPGRFSAAGWPVFYRSPPSPSPIDGLLRHADGAAPTCFLNAL